MQPSRSTDTPTVVPIGTGRTGSHRATTKDKVARHSTQKDTTAKARCRTACSRSVERRTGYRHPTLKEALLCLAGCRHRGVKEIADWEQKVADEAVAVGLPGGRRVT